MSLVGKKIDHDANTDSIELGTLHEAGLTHPYAAVSDAESVSALAAEANIILIAHPDEHRLGHRFRLSAGGKLDIGRDPQAQVSLPEVPSISRHHARLQFGSGGVTLEDLGSTNGTYINGELVRERTLLASGDRFQVAAVHFKFLHEQDVEHAYYRAISDLVTRDGLTDAFNKRTFAEQAEREVARARRYGRPLSIITIDIDRFKEINDEFGHLCGDFVLKRVAQVARELLRPEQMLARVGGDEFAILCPETDAERANNLAAKIRDRVAGLDYTYCNLQVNVTASLGVAQLGSGMRSVDDLYAAADEALYRSKSSGRNRVSS